IFTTLKRGDGWTTLELKLNFVRAMTKDTGLVRAEGRVIHRGRTVATSQGDRLPGGMMMRVRLVDGVRQRGAALMPRELAGGEAEAGDRAAEARLAGALEAEAGLHRQAAQRGAHGLALHPQRAGRQVRIAHRARALELDRADDRAVG